MISIFFYFLLNVSCKREEDIIVVKNTVNTEILTNSISEWDILIQALIEVESCGNIIAIGDKNSVGCLQITPIYVKDVNRILGDEIYTLDDRFDKQKSIDMFNILQNNYNKEQNIYKAIHLHNPRADKNYFNKVINNIENIKDSLSWKEI